MGTSDAPHNTSPGTEETRGRKEEQLESQLRASAVSPERSGKGEDMGNISPQSAPAPWPSQQPMYKSERLRFRGRGARANFVPPPRSHPLPKVQSTSPLRKTPPRPAPLKHSESGITSSPPEPPPLGDPSFGEAGGGIAPTDVKTSTEPKTDTVEDDPLAATREPSGKGGDPEAVGPPEAKKPPEMVCLNMALLDFFLG